MEHEQEPSKFDIDHMTRKELKLVVVLFGDSLTPYEKIRAMATLGDIQKISECDCGTALYYSATYVEAHPYFYTKTATPCLNCYDEIVRKNAFFIKSS